MSNIDLDNMPSMEELLQGSSVQAKSIQADTIVHGTIAQKNENGILLDVGGKSESFIDRSELKDFDTLQPGDGLDVYVERVEGENSAPQVSVKKALLQHAWEGIINNNQEGSIIEGTIVSSIKGGFSVDVGGVDAFLPRSQVDLGTLREPEFYVGQSMQFKIIKINEERKNVVLSRREILEAERERQRAQLFEELQPGQIRKGIVKNITDFGAFVDLNGMDGLLHNSDMSWKRISDPNTVVHKGQELEVMILEVDKTRQRISLGLKQKDGNPWDTVDVKYPVNSRVHGKVVNVMPYGAFVELEEGIEGLIHVSEMSWTKKVLRASDVLNIDDEVDAVVLNVDKIERKISLSLRQAQTNPWVLIKEKYPVGTRIKGKVRNMTGYGAFVQIQDDIDGMIHVSDMSWIRKVNNPSEILKKGDEVEAVILEVDDVNQRISLSMKKLTDDPWQTIQNKYKVGDIVEGKVTKMASFGAFVELEGGIDGLIHISELSDERVNRVKDVVNAGDIVRARVKNISTEDRRIGLSLRDVDGTGSASASQVSRLSAGDALGDFGAALDDALKDADASAQNEAEAAPTDAE